MSLDRAQSRQDRDFEYAPHMPHRDRPSRSSGTKGIDGRLYTPDVEDGLNTLVARVLGTPDGERLLAYLRNLTLNHAFEADVSPNTLMHKEGQRWLVGMLVQRLQKGNQP
jgi:hypothetical protein